MVSLLDKQSELIEIIRNNQLTTKKCLGLWLAEKNLFDPAADSQVKKTEFVFRVRPNPFSDPNLEKTSAMQRDYRNKK